ncbi:hypothetical protein [Amycolatopsis sp. cmx-4-83]|uniref:hypothetical protein n=1 Tax=Amycolatopsis sp. cmx-4-83 TaxID=2790940 RepID=UPI00397BCBF8
MPGFGKAVAQAIATVLAGLVPFLVDGHLSTVETVNLFLLAFATIGVAVVPNLNAGTAKYAKGVVAVGIAVLTLLATILASGTALGSGQIIQLILAGLGAVGVIALPAPQYPAGPVARPRPAGPTEV